MFSHKNLVSFPKIKTNLRKTILFLFIIYLTNDVKSQVWCPSGATWHYGFQTVDSDGYYKFKYVGDTILSSTSCKKIEKTLVYYNFWSFGYDTTILGYEYTYSDTDKVFLWRFNAFYALYDFSAIVGDTLLVPGNNQYVGCDTIGYVKVDSTGTMTINSQSLRYYAVSNLTGSNWGWNCRIVEKIGPLYNYSGGALNYFLPVKLDACGMVLDEVAEGGTFRCYEDDVFPTFSSITQPCEYTLNSNEIVSEKLGFKIFPNPASENIVIESNNQLTLLIQDVLGKQLKQISITQIRTEISISDLSNGVYFIGTNNLSKKIVIHR